LCRYFNPPFFQSFQPMNCCGPQSFPTATETVQLHYPPVYILVHMLRTKANTLEGLESGILPITPLTKTFSVATSGSQKFTVTHQQLPITPAYAFTDYCSQAQTINHCIVDLATPSSGQLTPFNTYVALSRSHDRDSIWLLCEFNEKLFTHHPCEHLRQEDEWLSSCFPLEHQG